MDMYQKRKIRQEKVKNEDKEENSKSNINWYPGHMAKTKKQIIQGIYQIRFSVLAKVFYSVDSSSLTTYHSRSIAGILCSFI